MKMNRTLLVALVASLSVTLPMTAQQSGTVAFTHLEKAGKIIGRAITDSRNQHIGRVNDLAIDLQEGRVAEVLVDTGGLLTSKQRIVAVPPQCFTAADSGGELRMNADIDTFDNAPEFNISAWKESTDAASVTDVYKRFHVQPYAPIGYLERTGKFMGLAAWNQRDQRLGKVEALVVDLPSGRLAEVIMRSTGFLGIKNELTAVPPQAFLFEPDYNTLILDTTKEAMKNAPHFKAKDWRNSVNNSLSLSAVDNSLKVLRSWNVDNRASDGDTQGDAAITLEIEHKILATDGLSIDARHVQVTTRQGRVTLRGAADSDREKQQLGDIAASVVAADHVDNQIEVRVFAIATLE